MVNNIQLNGNAIVNPYLNKFQIAQINFNLAVMEEPGLSKRYRRKSGKRKRE